MYINLYVIKIITWTYSVILQLLLYHSVQMCAHPNDIIKINMLHLV